MTVFAGTSHYSEQRSSPSVLVKLPFPTADPVELTRAAHRLLPLIENGIRYARAGIMLTDLRPADAHQPSSCSAMRMKRPASRSSSTRCSARKAASSWGLDMEDSARDRHGR